MQHHGTAVPVAGLPGLSRPGSAGDGLSDEVLAKACRAGDRDAFAEIYRRYAGPVRAYIRRRVPDHAAHEDLVQEVFAEALARLDGFCDNQPDAFRMWFYGAVARPVLSARGLARWREAQAIRETISELARAWRQAYDPAVPPRPLSPDLADAVAALPERQRQVMELRYIEGLPVEQVAGLLGMAPNQVTATASKAARKLGRPAGVTVNAPADNGAPRVYPDRCAGGWRGYIYLVGPGGTRQRRDFHAVTREAAIARWAQLSGADLAGVA